MFLWVHYTDMVTAILQLPVAVAALWAVTRSPAARVAGPSRVLDALFALLLGAA